MRGYDLTHRLTRGRRQREFVAGDPHQISVELRSNSGMVKLANREYTVRISRTRIESGTTDDDGLLTIENVPAGEYEFDIDGHPTGHRLVSTPVGEEPTPLRLTGFYLGEVTPAEADDGDDDAYDPEENIITVCGDLHLDVDFRVAEQLNADDADNDDQLDAEQTDGDQEDDDSDSESSGDQPPGTPQVPSNTPPSTPSGPFG